MQEISHEAAKAIFEEIEPSLASIAAKRKIQDPVGEARSWYARFIDIMRAFNSGSLTREIHREDGTVESLPETPTAEQSAAFIKSLKSYLRTAFKNDLNQAYNRQKRFVNTPDPHFEHYTIDSNKHLVLGTEVTKINAHSEEEVIKLSDLIGLIESDCNRKKRSVAVARDRINYLFLLATLKFYKKFMRDYGDMPIVRDLSAKDARDFFIFDIREGRTEAIGSILEDLVSKETVRAVLLNSKELLSPDKGYFTLNRKISRYFNNAMGGMPNRLKKLRFSRSELEGDFDIW